MRRVGGDSDTREPAMFSGQYVNSELLLSSFSAEHSSSASIHSGALFLLCWKAIIWDCSWTFDCRKFFVGNLSVKIRVVIDSFFFLYSAERPAPDLSLLSQDVFT